MKCLICGREIDIQKESFECDSEGVIQHIACKELQDSKVGYDMLRDYLSQSKKVADLEAKIAESDAYKLRIELAGADETIAQLKRQLAEKDEELSEALAKQAIICLNTIENAYQDKISFCVEQLEKVKDFCDGIKWAMVHLTKEDTQTIQTVLDEIDNQITLLKE